MRKLFPSCLRLLIAALPLMLPSQSAFRRDWGCLDITKWFQGTKVDEHCPKTCKQCGHETCIERAPVRRLRQGREKSLQDKHPLRADGRPRGEVQVGMEVCGEGDPGRILQDRVRYGES